MKILLIRNPAYIYTIVFFCLAGAGCTDRNPVTTQIIHDTVYLKDKSNDVLRGTTVLKASETNMETRAVHGLWLDDLKSSECLEPMTETPPATEITSVKQTDDTTLLITANIVSNCSYNFLGEIEVVGGNTLNLIYHGYGGFASCNCCFGLTYKIYLDREGDYKFNKLKYVTIKGFLKTSLPAIK
jgi:hypothetical protein